jgi:hypothetical protein
MSRRSPNPPALLLFALISLTPLTLCGGLLTAPSASVFGSSSGTPEDRAGLGLFVDPVGDVLVQEPTFFEDEDSMDVLDELVKVVPSGTDQVPGGGLSAGGTDTNMMTAMGLVEAGKLELRATGERPDPRMVEGAPTYSRPEDGPVKDSEAVPPEEEWATGKVRDGLLLKERPLPVPPPLEAEIRNVQDVITVIPDSTDPASPPGLGPNGEMPGTFDPKMSTIARGIIHKNMAMGEPGGGFESDRAQVNGRSEWSYDPTIPNQVSHGIDFAVDIAPNDAGKEAINKAHKLYVENQKKGRPIGYHPSDDDDPEDRI